MKRYRVVSVIIAVIMMISLFGCTDDTTSKDVVLTDVLASINTQCNIDADSMLSITTTDDLELYYNIAPADVKQFAAETTKNSSTDITEIILVEAVDAEAAQRVYDCLDIRYNSQRDLCASYSAELLAIVDMCDVVKDGNFVTLIMSEDTAEITAHYNSFFE